MTDLKAPERIWARPGTYPAYDGEWSDGEFSSDAGSSDTEYVHIALFNALTAACESLQDRLDTANKARANLMSLALRKSNRVTTLEASLATMAADLATAKALLAEAAGDLSVSIRTEYPIDACENRPDIQRLYDRDMDIVRRILAVLNQKQETPT
jgi:hypothetical protein